MADTPIPDPVKHKKTRSPGYPYIDLATAVKRAEIFYQHEKRNAAPFRIAAQHWGSTEKSSAAILTAAALKSFGLINEPEGSDRRLQLSELALRIILDKRPESVDRSEAIRKAALMPRMHQLLWDRYGNNLPCDPNLEHELVWEWKFNENSVADFIREYKATIAFAKLLHFDKLSDEEVDKSSSEVIAVGDYVQWESLGVSQFSVPRRVREISEDGEWVFVEGSNTAVPLRDVILMPAPANLDFEKKAPSVVPLPGTADAHQYARGLPFAAAAPKTRSNVWTLSAEFTARLDLVGEPQGEEDLESLRDYVDITIKALLRSLKKAQTEPERGA